MSTIVSISLGDDLPAILDAEAKRQRRTRSFIVSEAIRAYVAVVEREQFSAARERTLRESLALSPAERVQLSEELWGEFAHLRPLEKGWTASFDTFEEYEQWRRSTRSGLQ